MQVATFVRLLRLLAAGSATEPADLHRRKETADRVAPTLRRPSLTAVRETGNETCRRVSLPCFCTTLSVEF